MSEEKKRDILDLSSPSEKTLDVKPSRPVVAPDTGTQFLDDFLAEEVPLNEAPSESIVQMPHLEADPNWPEGVEEGDLHGAAIARLKTIYDPEIPVNIYEMGLIYDVIIHGDDSAEIIMTLTTPHCPVAETMPGEIEYQVGIIPGITKVDVKLVWEPPWDMSRMSDEARLELGLL